MHLHTSPLFPDMHLQSTYSIVWPSLFLRLDPLDFLYFMIFVLNVLQRAFD